MDERIVDRGLQEPPLEQWSVHRACASIPVEARRPGSGLVRAMPVFDRTSEPPAFFVECVRRVVVVFAEDVSGESANVGRVALAGAARISVDPNLTPQLVLAIGSLAFAHCPHCDRDQVLASQRPTAVIERVRPASRILRHMRTVDRPAASRTSREPRPTGTHLPGRDRHGIRGGSRFVLSQAPERLDLRTSRSLQSFRAVRA